MAHAIRKSRLFARSISGWRWLLLAALTGLMLGCGSTRNYAPVEDRAASARKPVPNTGVARASSGARLPGAENADKPGYYSVKPGDTLIRIGLESGQSWKDLAQWNNLSNPNVIEVGQVLRIVPPASDPGAADARPVPSAAVETRPLDARAAIASPSASAAAAPLAAASSATAPVIARAGDEQITWMWPADGPVIATFDEARSKGLSFGGQAGDPVLAAADGRVVYAGSSLRGYGNLLILKHNSTYLTAYAHNQTLLVKEDQFVRRGQKIAEMGSTDADRVQLHFEIRRLGKPVDPSTLLPPR